jgi:hypothetical protein
MLSIYYALVTYTNYFSFSQGYIESCASIFNLFIKKAGTKVINQVMIIIFRNHDFLWTYHEDSYYTM